MTKNLSYRFKFSRDEAEIIRAALSKDLDFWQDRVDRGYDVSPGFLKDLENLVDRIETDLGYK
jgi:hypothetical protein